MTQVSDPERLEIAPTLTKLRPELMDAPDEVGVDELDEDILEDGAIKQRYPLDPRVAVLQSVNADRHDKEAAASSLYNELYGVVLTAVRSIDNPPEDMEEIIQDAFIRLFQHIDKYQAKAKFSVWAYRVTVNVAKDYHRKGYGLQKGHFPVPKYGDTDSEYNLIHLSNSLSIENQSSILAYEMIDELRTKLEPHYFDTLLLRSEGYDYDEIANKLDVPIGTVRSRLSKARQLATKILNTTFTTST